MSALERQVGGSHYRDLRFQPIEYIIKNELGFCEGNIVKYITRWKLKGGREDLEKVIHYAQILLDYPSPKVESTEDQLRDQVNLLFKTKRHAPPVSEYDLQEYHDYEQALWDSEAALRANIRARYEDILAGVDPYYNTYTHKHSVTPVGDVNVATGKWYGHTNLEKS